MMSECLINLPKSDIAIYPFDATGGLSISIGTINIFARPEHCTIQQASVNALYAHHFCITAGELAMRVSIVDPTEAQALTNLLSNLCSKFQEAQ